jgi:DNA ligase 1
MITSIKAILDELNLENGSNYKMDVLKKYTDNKLLQRVLKMAYDRVTFTYGITMKNIAEISNYSGDIDLETALNVLENEFSTRKTTGNAAILMLEQTLFGLSADDAYVIEKILMRDLRINMGRSNINKVFKNLIVKPVYMRCGLFTLDKTVEGKLKKGTFRKIEQKGAYCQLKADGTYREVTVENGKVSYNSRSGESYDYPVLSDAFESLPDGKYIGELTVIRDGKVLNRSEGNGLINSSNPPHNEIVIDLWDYVTLLEYSNAANKIKNTTPYSERYNKLVEIVTESNPEVQLDSNIRIIETKIVQSFAEALKYTSEWMNEGLEGAILKDANALFRDGTSAEQLKLKLEIDAEVRITGFIEGRAGTSRVNTFGSMTFENDEGTVKGSCSGFTDAQLLDFNSRREELIGQVITVQFNDITKGRDSVVYALSHPRFIEVRTDKSETDTLERMIESKDMAMNLEGSI